MAIENIFSVVDKAILVSTGNSLIVCGSATEPEINTSDLIKTDGTTTRNWTESGSTANLNILSDSRILYAELMWYSSVFSNVQGALDLRSIQDNPILFTTSKGTYEINPTFTESYTSLSGTVDRYRSAIVTEYVQAALSGSYTVANVPISVPISGLSNSRGGWALSVIYRNEIFNPQKITYSSGILPTTPDTPLQYTLTGFTASQHEKYLKGSITMIVANGGPLNGLETVSAGPSFVELNNIGNSIFAPNPNPGTKPNNPGNSFFSGLINTADPLSSGNGLININGTNGTNNNDGFVPTQLVGARNKWDITNVDISNTLIPNQNLLAMQVTTGTLGDGIEVLGIGAQVYTQAPNIISRLDAYDIDGDEEYNVEVGEVQVYGVRISNDGEIEATNVRISAVINPVSTFMPGYVSINGVVNPTANIVEGINLGTIKAKGIVNVLFSVRINSVPVGGVLYQNVDYNYTFNSEGESFTNYSVTNTIALIVQDGKLSITKSASKSTMILNDVVTYTVDIKNIGTELALNMFFQDKMDVNCSFVEGTVIIDGISYAEYNPVSGIELPNLPAEESTQIIFQAKVNTLPPTTKVTNISFISFGYIFNQYGYLREKTTASNRTIIQIQFVDIVGERCNDTSYPKVGDTVIYTLSLTNMGNVPAVGVQVLEPPIPGATFVNGSVKINGVSETTLNPFNGFTLASPINPKQTTDIQYSVLINSINPNSLIENIAKVPFKYEISEADIVEYQMYSNIVDTVANYVCMDIAKSVNTSYAEIGDTLFYTITVTNSGNINAINTELLDILQANLSFVAGSVTINGIPYPSYDPTIGFNLGIVCPSDVIQVVFQAKVISRPTPNVIYNNGSIIYQYRPNPSGSILTETIISNTVETIINEAKYSVVKSVNKAYAQVGDTLIYTTVIQNLGTVALTNMKFADYTGVYLYFITGSIYINGINYPDLKPEEQFSIPDMYPGDTTTIVFEVIILANNPTTLIPNISEVTLSYKQSPDSPTIRKTVKSNTAITIDPFAVINMVKSVDKEYAAVGEILTYHFNISNDGSAVAINTLFTDIIQAEATFVQESVFINGVWFPNYDPQIGFTLGDILMGQVINVKFSVIVNSIPNPNYIKDNGITRFSYYVDPTEQPVTRTSKSNIVTTIINTYSASLTKAVDTAYATIGDIVAYVVTATNTGTVPLTNVNFIDLVPSGAEFIAGSVIVNGENNPDANPNTGFIINDILPSSSAVIMFKAIVTSIPNPPQINNTAKLYLKYRLSPTTPYVEDTLTSNTVTTNINVMSITNTKTVSKAYATVPDILTYTSVISNDGNISVKNTNFIDNVAEHLSFIAGTVKINGVVYPAYNPNMGFTVGDITAGSQVIVTFDVAVDSVPPSGYVTNSSIINFEYKIYPDKPYILGDKVSNIVTTYINLGNLTITKAADRTIVRLTNVIKYNFVIANTGNTILKNLFFKDIIQEESSFNNGTVYVNGVNRASYNPNTGFNLDDIQIGQETIINFEVTANSIPTTHMLINSGDINYSYYVDPQGQLVNKAKTSNTTTVYVYDTIVSANKAVDKALAKQGDTLNFTITINNDGNIPAEHVVFQDILDNHISFVTDSVYVNGIQKLGYNPNIGFNLEDIGVGGETTVTFTAIVISRPPKNIIYNFATIDYDYTVGTEVITATINTNITETHFAIGELTITKTVDYLYATVGDNLAYTVTVINTGSVNATNLNFLDLIQNEASFNYGTVVVDGISQPTFNPKDGFILTNLIPNDFHVITFSVNVNSLPQSGEIDNIADVTFTYKLTPTDTPVTITSYSNTAITYIRLGKLEAIKVVDKAYATIGDILNYTIAISNLGNANCFNVFFQDIVQSNASFIEGTVKINGVIYPNYNPNIGFYLDDISGYGNAVVTFKVTVMTVPLDYTIYNFSTDIYKYYIDPSHEPIITEGKSNTVVTIINVGKVEVVKSVNKAYATIGDVVTYTINVSNTGNVEAKNVNFRDAIPTGLSFVPSTVSVNGVVHPTYDPNTSFTLGNIAANNTVIVSFDAVVITIPNPSLVSNIANITFTYKVNPSGGDITVVANSNVVWTQINYGSLSIIKSVDKTYATMGDIITYNIIVGNNGNVKAENILFTDILQSDVLFNIGSVKIDGVEYPDYNPNIGFYLQDLNPTQSVIVTFKVTVSQTPTQNFLSNSAVVDFNYKIDPNEQYYSKSVKSNTVITWIIMSALTLTKQVDKAYATIDDILNYSVLIKNSGNTTISDLVFIDYLSSGAVFVGGTVVIDGVSYPTYNPILGFNIPNSIVAGSTILVEFKAKVTIVPSPPIVNNYAVVDGVYYVNPEGPSYPVTSTSNIVITNINIGSILNVKDVDKKYAIVNDSINYTSTITNNGNVDLTNLYFTDILDSNLSFEVGSVSINGVTYPSLDPRVGFQLTNLAPLQTMTVEFTAKIISLPTQGYVTNNSNVQYSYKIDPNGFVITKDKLSNTVITNVVLGKLEALKSVDKLIATIGDELTYTVTLTNSGNVIDNNVFFQDTPSFGVIFKVGSVKINNSSHPTYNPTIGFDIGDIGVGNVVVVSFVVIVTSVPPSNKVTNEAIVPFKYVVDPQQLPYNSTAYSNIVTTNIAYGNLDVTKTVNKKYATIGDKLTYTITITNIGNIDATNVIFIDQIPHNTMFVIGSITVNGVSYPDYNPSAGFDLGTITPGQIITVVYKVEVLDLC